MCSPINAPAGAQRSVTTNLKTNRDLGNPSDLRGDADFVLELTDATVVKGGRPVLDGLTLTIRRGEHTAILGPNGAGKTTLINLLTRNDYALARPDGVAPVKIFGAATWDVFELRTRLGIVTTDLHQLFVEGHSVGRITGEEAVLSGFFATRGFLLYATVTDAMRRAAADSLERVDAGMLAHRTLDQMSTGEARRVLIARALVTSPEALVLDEPAAGLDPVARHRFLESIGRVAESGTTIVLVTHHVEEIVPAITQVVVLQRGRAAVAGPKHEVLTSAHLSRAFEAPFLVEEVDGFYYARPDRLR
jgi:iron complex transport system ATP-binding protein